jgi:hypothetical protein
MTLMEAAKQIMPGFKWKRRHTRDRGRSEGIVANFPFPGRQLWLERLAPTHDHKPGHILASCALPIGTTDEVEALNIMRKSVAEQARLLQEALNATPTP